MMDESIITVAYEDYAREDGGELPNWVANYPGLTGMKPPSEDNGYHEIETKYIMTYNLYFEKD